MIYTILGGFFGDEGKGKILNAIMLKKLKNKPMFFSKYANKNILAYNIRINGGPNGGHALEINNTRIAGHVLPSSITKENILNVIGAGCAIYPKGLVEEINNFKKANLFKGMLAIDDNVEIIIEPYKVLDGLRSKRNSTGSGIRYVYGNKFKRTGLKARDLYALDLKEKLSQILNDFYAEYYMFLHLEENNDLDKPLKKESFLKYKKFKEKYSFENIYNCLKQSGKFLKKYVSAEIASELREASFENKPIFTEGSQSYFLGIFSRLEKGTSSIIDPTAIFFTQNIPQQKQEIYFVVKAFGSRVGNGYFVGEFGSRSEALKKPELLKQLGFKENAKRKEYLKKATELMLSKNPEEKANGFRLFYNEFGETTKFPRGKAPLDLVALRTLYNYVAKNSLQKVYLVINQIDGLELFDKIPLIVKYKYKNQEYDLIPPFTDIELKKVKPIIKEVKSWDKKINKKTKDQKEFKGYINFIEKETCFKIKVIGYGPKNTDILFL